MAIHLCCMCEGLLREGDYVQVSVRTTYHRLKSKIAYALDKNDMAPDPRSLAHVDCIEEPEDDDPLKDVLN